MEQLEDMIYFNRYMDQLNFLAIFFDSQARIVTINGAGCELLGKQEYELVGKKWPNESHLHDMFDSVCCSQPRTGQLDKRKCEIKTHSGKIKTLLLTFTRIKESNNDEGNILCVGEEIPEPLNTGRSLSCQEGLLQCLLELDIIGALILNEENKITEINNCLLEMLSVQEESMLVGSRFDSLLTVATEKESFQQSIKMLQSGKLDHYQASVCCGVNNQQQATISIVVKYVKPIDERAGYFILLSPDLSNRIKKEHQHSNLLIREIHHRIKNNLQGIIGLLSTQGLKYPACCEAFDDSIRQVGAIAATYGIQSQGDNGEVLLVNLVKTAANSGNMVNGVVNKIHFNLPEISGITISGNDAAHFSLAINELVHNAFKYSSDHTQNVSVSMVVHPERVVLVIDNPTELQAFPVLNEKNKGSGLQMAQALLPRDQSKLIFSIHNKYVCCTIELFSPYISGLEIE